MFSIQCDAQRALVHARMSGFLDVAEVDDFFREEQQAVRQIGCRSGEYLVIVDAGDAVIQSQQVIAAFMERIARLPLKARRVAVVRAASLARMQAQRIVQLREDAAIFATVAEAEAWLFAP